MVGLLNVKCLAYRLFKMNRQLAIFIKPAYGRGVVNPM